LTPPSPPVVTGPLDEPPPPVDPLDEPPDVPPELLAPDDPLEEVAPDDAPVEPSSPELSLLGSPNVEGLFPLQPRAVAPMSAPIPMTVAIFIVSSFRPHWPTLGAWNARASAGSPAP